MLLPSLPSTFLSLAVLALTPTLAAAQAATPQPKLPASTVPDAKANTLLDGTPVKLRLAETISSSSAKTGQQVPFEVLEDVQVGGVTVIAKGSTALASVTDAEHKKSMGRGGKLELNIDSVRLVDNEKAQLRATAGGKAGGHVGAMTGAMVATGLLFFPAAPLFLFIHGKDLTLPKGLETTAFVDGDMKLAPQQIAEGNTASASPVSVVAIEASVPNCDIDVDGAFAGNTPSQLSLANGKHEIKIHKNGYTDWTRTLTISGGAVKLSADLQPSAAVAR